MRLHCFILLTILAACGDEPPGAGTEGHTCRNFPSPYPCDDALRCLDNICVPCGDIDMMCCDNIGGPFCNNALACDDSAENLGNCTGSCGSIGLACCSDETCPGGGTCNNDGLCEGEQSDPCFDGTTPHELIIIDSLCGALPITFRTNTAEEAEDCRAQYVAAANPDEEVCALGTTPTTTSVCKDGWGALQLHHCSSEQLATCELNWCDTCTWTTTTADCPNGP